MSTSGRSTTRHSRSGGESSASSSIGQSVTSYSSRRQLNMPDWGEVQSEYIKSIRSGRHPVSFKHKGELWFHCDATNKRLDRVSKGHSLTSAGFDSFAAEVLPGLSGPAMERIGRQAEPREHGRAAAHGRLGDVRAG